MPNLDILAKDWFLHQILRMIFKKKYFSCYILSTDQVSFRGILGNMPIVVIYFALNDDFINFESNLSFLIKPFSHMILKNENSF